MKVVVIPSNINNLSRYKKIGADAFIFGLVDYSVHIPVKLTLEKIKQVICDFPDIEIFISINKTIFNHEIDDLKKMLLELDKLNIKGILFYDLALLQLKNDLGLSIDLVWNQTHIVTNYNTCNFYFRNNVKYGVISNEITLDETLEIMNKSCMKFMRLIIGHPIMSHSKRKLISNYYSSIGTNNSEYLKMIEENNQKYLVEEDHNGTTIIDNEIINASCFIKDLEKLEYAIVSNMYIDDEVFFKVLESFISLKYDFNNEDLLNINSLIGENTGFFMKKTIFKVKKDG